MREKLVQAAIETASRTTAVIVGLVFVGILAWIAVEIRIEVFRQSVISAVNNAKANAAKKAN